MRNVSNEAARRFCLAVMREAGAATAAADAGSPARGPDLKALALAGLAASHRRRGVCAGCPGCRAAEAPAARAAAAERAAETALKRRSPWASPPRLPRELRLPEAPAPALRRRAAGGE